MSPLQDRLAERDREMEVYLRFLALLDENPTLKVSRRRRSVDERVIKILKANTFLLIYNFVEASIRDAFRVLYSAMSTDGCRVRSVSERLRHLWVDAAVHRVMPQSANQDTYRAVTRQLVADAVRNVSTAFNVEQLRFGGNLDAAQIRKTCCDHGVSVRTHRNARGGEKLVLVKSRRNDLAHGNLSFSECGRDYTVAQLVEIRRETVLFVRGVLQSVERYVSRRGFRSAP